MSETERASVYEVWAPREGLWTPWVKAVLFAHVGGPEHAPAPAPRAPWLRADLLHVDASPQDYRSSAAPPRVAVVADLPGAEGIAAGLELAALGFRPVPLYAALPHHAAVLPVGGMVGALAAGAPRLAACALPRDAPPAFLLDDRRAGARLLMRVDLFDNRSMVFATDFPSADRLRAAGIAAVVVIRRATLGIQHDLAAVLRRWQEGGLRLFSMDAEAPAPASPLTVRRPGPFARLDLWMTRAALRRDARGAFGTWIPERAQGG